MVLLHLECLTALVGDHPTHRLALLSVFSILSYFIIKRVISSLALGMAYKANHCQRPPKYPHKDPIFGLDFIFDSITGLRTGRLLDTQAGHFRRAGANTFYTWVLGRQAIVTMEPENIKAILATNFKDYMIGGRKDILGSLLGNGIFVLDGEEWAHSRALLRPNFVRDQLADLDMFERHIQELFHVLPRDSSVVELQQLLLRFTMDSATEFLFGHSTSTLTDATAADEEFREALTFSLRSLSKRIQRGPLNQFLPRETAEELRAHKTCRDYVNIFVDQAMGLGEKTGSGATEGGSDEETGRYYFLKELIRAFDDKERICDELLSILLAGRDTTAALLSNVFHVLSRRPDLWHKLRNEVQDFSGNPPSYAQLRNLRFSKYIINETLRLYPPIAINSRKAVRDTILPTGGGPNGTSPIFIPKDTRVLYNTRSMHRREDFYGPDALEFRPERWETERHGWEYLPFNGGPRICLGQQYALTESIYVMVRIAQEFSSIETVDGSPWKEDFLLTVMNKNPVYCKLTRS
ncbi:hypothetical protein NQ176_g2540 [Zarea fungicola]|uniref:Uncharacterized protein n=1 Tax=Zarea fungicola TaxID=93591 RepID=A0ACC1NMV7_9HYPO|nr:hypothetical protein NQ176_g2540 [Lecanicillium fungicola]